MCTKVKMVYRSSDVLIYIILILNVLSQVKNFLTDLYPQMSAGQDGFDARFNMAIVRPKALTRKESSIYEEVLTRSNLQDLNDLFNTIYRDHNGEDVEVIYCLDEEALAEFDEFDEQICSRLNSSWQTGNLMTRAIKERRTLNEYFQKQKEIIEKVCSMFQIVL